MVVIVNALRTPIGRFGGALASVPPEDLLALVINNNLSLSGLTPDLVDEIIVGQTKQSAHTPNIARVSALKAIFPESVTGYTVHRQCGSGMQAVANAYQSIATGQSEIVLAGGVESMSQAPYYFVGNRFGIQPGDLTLYDSNTESQPRSQPQSRYGHFTMGETAEWLADKYAISREEQDAYALKSQQKARRAIQTHAFTDEIVPVEIQEGKLGTRLFAVDEHPRETTLEKLAKLAPVFREGGTVTAGNSSGRNDGAAMLLMMKEERALALGLTPLARIRSFAAAGVSPKEMGIGPVPASQKALAIAGLELGDMELIELNEAFAAQSLAVLKEWGITEERVNVNGGAIALGHPLGCSGARILVTLVHEMRKRDAKYGLGTLCIAGGQGMAMVVEKWEE
ncbi:acetyl-CoA acetyltransferase [Brevibacillus panacihumi W25]|uniref:acetyl-CoA C-acetyltransferase n=1 Tax=Brevibacillus panacihumi W25 TaxID=1408254 RepID=V6M3J5_9BACL|nr:thiolase family protein [Brevibacillus panacihumi]EST53149.1 acetyl-CoA acetyltransferase [Brevibacillus panacihumi W25]